MNVWSKESPTFPKTMLVSEFSYMDFLFALVVMKQQNQRAHSNVHVYTIYIQSSSLQISEERTIFLNQFIPNTQDFTFSLFHRKWCFNLQSNPPKYTVAAHGQWVFLGKWLKKKSMCWGNCSIGMVGIWTSTWAKSRSTKSDLRSVSWTMLLIPGAKRRGSKEQQPYEGPKHEYLVDGSQNKRH